MSATFQRSPPIFEAIPDPTITGSLLSPAKCHVPVESVDKDVAAGFVMCSKKHAELCKQHGILQAGAGGFIGCIPATRVIDNSKDTSKQVSLKGVQGRYKAQATYGFGVCERLCKAIGAPCSKQTQLVKLPAFDAAYANITYLTSKAAGGEVMLNCTFDYTVIVEDDRNIPAPVMLAQDKIVTGAYKPPRRASMMACSKQGR